VTTGDIPVYRHYQIKFPALGRAVFYALQDC